MPSNGDKALKTTVVNLRWKALQEFLEDTDRRERWHAVLTDEKEKLHKSIQIELSLVLQILTICQYMWRKKLGVATECKRGYI